uniref:Annexin n=1 Tax=Knipowitschia caucasica TaxID=637954 RepID=A0AAV2L8G7_KNICA
MTEVQAELGLPQHLLISESPTRWGSRQKMIERFLEQEKAITRVLGTDENAIIELLGNRTNKQRVPMVAAYKTTYGKDLMRDLKSELTGNLENLVLAMLMTPSQFDAAELREAIKDLCVGGGEGVRGWGVRKGEGVRRGGGGGGGGGLEECATFSNDDGQLQESHSFPLTAERTDSLLSNG